MSMAGTTDTVTTDRASAVPGLGHVYGLVTRRRWLLLGFMALVVVIALGVDIATGPSGLSLLDVLRGIVLPDTLSRAESVIIWHVRLPISLMALLVGAALGLAGAEMQTSLNNPLASPYTLGIAAAATLGASLAITFDLFPSVGWLANTAIPFLAFLFAMGSSLLILQVSRLYNASTEIIVLFGIAMLFAMEALVSLVQFIADTDTLQQIVFWTMGSLMRATWPKITIVAVVFTVCAGLSIRQIWHLTMLRSGEEQSRSLGINVSRLRTGVLIRASLLTAVAVSFVGAIGFIGLVAPHISRLLLGEDHRFYLPGSVLAGAITMLLASIASKLVMPGIILPVGIVTALAGIPIFVGLILLQRRGL